VSAASLPASHLVEYIGSLASRLRLFWKLAIFGLTRFLAGWAKIP